MTKTLLTRLAALLAIALVAAACGGRSLDNKPVGPVSAVNLSSGEIKTFSSGDSVPAGWAACKDASCADALATMPCTNLGETTCTKNPTCRLIETDCSGGGTTCAGTDCPPVAPPKCNYRCAPKTPLMCNELKAASDCKSRSDCQWEQGPCPAIACAPGQPCPPCPYSCRAKAPPKCSTLSENQCKARASDCVWAARPCLFWCDASDPTCQCGPFCQDRGKTCPSIAAPGPDFCRDGKIEAKYDADGCVTGFTCRRDTCPPLGLPYPVCKPDEIVVEKKDSKGCITGYACEPKCAPMPPIAPPTCKDGEKLVEKKDSKGCLIGWECVKHQCPPPPPIAPCPPDRVFVPKYDSNGCLVGGSCQLTTKVECDKIAKAYDAAMLQAKQCNPASTAPVIQCGTRVNDQLACGCPTFVNSLSQYTGELSKLQKQWDGLRCGAGIACPAMPCFLPKSGSCQGTGTTGTCKDN